MTKILSDEALEEINFVKYINKTKKEDLLKLRDIVGSNDYTAVHVCRQPYSEIFGKKIWPKADIYLAKGFLEENFLAENDFYISEDKIEILKLIPIPKTGISVKRQDSKRYQITKLTPHSFAKIFGSYELGAGASIYCQKHAELPKNFALLSGWNTTIAKFSTYFGGLGIDASALFSENIKDDALDIASKIKSISNKQIKNIIDTNPIISDYIFKGVGLYNEPYPAHWLFEKGKFKQNNAMPYSVTTGSGRSKGTYTVVIKPA